MDETLDEVPGSKIIKSMRLTLDIIKTNKYNKPWKVIYKEDWQTEKTIVAIHGQSYFYDMHGKRVVKAIVDCNNTTLVDTDSGVYTLDVETTEYIVKCINEREGD
jgi:hypothetical protein